MTCTVVTLLLSHLLTPCHIETGSDSIIRSEAGKYSTTAAHCSIRPSTRGTKLGVSNMCQTSKIFSRINFIIIFEGVTVFYCVCIIFLLVSCVRLCWWRRIVNDGGDMISAVSLSHEIMTRWLSARISPAPHHCTTHTNNHMINWDSLLPVKMLNNMYVILTSNNLLSESQKCIATTNILLLYRQMSSWRWSYISWCAVFMVSRISWENYWKNDCQVFSTWSHSPSSAELLICWQESQFKCRGCRWWCHELGLTWIMCLVHQSKAFSSASTILIS